MHRMFNKELYLRIIKAWDVTYSKNEVFKDKFSWIFSNTHTEAKLEWDLLINI